MSDARGDNVAGSLLATGGWFFDAPPPYEDRAHTVAGVSLLSYVGSLFFAPSPREKQRFHLHASLFIVILLFYVILLALSVYCSDPDYPAAEID